MSDEAQELLERLVRTYGKRDEEGRRAYATALAAVALFLRANNHQDCAGWLETLARDLNDVEMTGHVGPTLRPDKNPGNALPGRVHKFHLLVAVGVKALIISGMSRPVAAKEAIRKVESLKHVSTKKILGWMDELGRKRSRTPLLYRSLVKLAKQGDPKPFAESCFQQANGLGISQAL